jgi:hypothetical protein
MDVHCGRVGREDKRTEGRSASTNEHLPLTIRWADDVLMEAFKPYPKMQDTT